MRLGSLFFSIVSFLLVLVIHSAAWAEDVVYLKDGSIIHGTITEEVPGVSIKIETKDENVFVYKMALVQKITHSKPAAEESDNSDNSGNSENTAVKRAAPAPKNKVNTVKNDSHAKFNKFGFLLNGGFWGPGVYDEFNSDLESATGSTAYDYLPGFIKGGVGLGWFTNNFGLKWNFQISLQPNDYSTDWYYGGYYAGTTTEDTFIFIGGTELEADIDFDNITNKDNVNSFYIPLIVGIWDVEYNISDEYGSEDFTATTADFGSGIGFRGFDSSNLVWDFQCVYRASSRGNYLEDPNGIKIPLVNGKYIDADVSGLDLNFTIGFLMQ